MQTLEPPQYVYWYHNDKIINYDTKRTRVSFDLGKEEEGEVQEVEIVLCRGKHQEDEQSFGDSLGAEVR